MSVILLEIETATVFSDSFLYCLKSGLVLLGEIDSAISYAMQYAPRLRGDVVDFIDSVFTLL